MHKINLYIFIDYTTAVISYAGIFSDIFVQENQNINGVTSDFCIALGSLISERTYIRTCPYAKLDKDLIRDSLKQT